MNNMFQVKPNVCGLRRKKNVMQRKFKTIKYRKCSFKYIGSHRSIWNLLPENFQNAEMSNVLRDIYTSVGGSNM